MIIYQNQNYVVKLSEEFYKVLELIKEKSKSKKIRVLIQLPDGLKPFFDKIGDEVRKYCNNCEIWFWFDTNFGACDYPFYFKELGFDLVIHIGHSKLFYDLLLHRDI